MVCSRRLRSPLPGAKFCKSEEKSNLGPGSRFSDGFLGAIAARKRGAEEKAKAALLAPNVTNATNATDPNATDPNATNATNATKPLTGIFRDVVDLAGLAKEGLGLRWRHRGLRVQGLGFRV